MTQVPIRWKVTLAFAATLTVVLSALGMFLYVRMGSELTKSIDRGLDARAGEIVALVKRSPDGLQRGDATGLEADESVAQVLGPAGEVQATSSGASRPVLGGDLLRRARRAPIRVDRPGDDVVDEALRLRAVPVSARGELLVVVTGASSDERDEALRSLLVLELIGLTAALLLAGAAGYFVAGVALRPVEAMRAEAEAIEATPGRRLPVPPADDELGRLGATLNAMLERLERAAAKDRRFVADASHELRTPLTTLKSGIELALMEGGDAAELESALRSAGEETDRLARLANDLLVLAQADEGRLPIRPEPLDVADLLEATAARHRVAGRPIVVEVDGAPTIRADRLRLEQALTNLVANALHHGAGEIRLSALHDEGVVRITVSDDGPGFPPELAERAFDRFTRGDPGRAGPGAGLGLAIVAAVAAAHGGSASGTQGPRPAIELVLPA